jgi:SCY1-like protein 1
VDSYNFGTLIYEVFNGEFHGPDQAGQTKNIPPSMQTSYKRLCNPNPKARISAGNFLDLGRRAGSFFDTPLIHLTEGIESLGVKNPDEREEFLKQVFS